MIIDSVRLRNFRSHSDTAVEFGTGINVILGENGAGKTSILEAISFALFKDYGGSIENLIMNSRNEMGVEAVFTSHGRTYRVVRSRKKGSSAASLFLREDGSEKLLQEGDSGVDREIEEILGIDRYLFTNAVYVRQGEIAALLAARPSERKQLVGRLLGIDVLEKVWERMRAVMDAFRERRVRLEAGAGEEDRAAEQLEGIDCQLSDVNGRIAKTRKSISELAASLEKAESGEKKLVEKEKKYLEAVSILNSVGAMLEREREMLYANRRRAGEIAEAEKGMAEIGKSISPGWKESLENRVRENRKKASSMDEKIGTLMGRVSEMEDLGSKLEGAGNRCPLCGSELTEKHKVQLIRERSGKAAEIGKKISMLRRQKEEMLEEAERLQEKIKKLTGIESRLSELRGAAAGGAAARKALEESENVCTNLTRRLKSLEAGMGESEGTGKELEKAREKVRELRSELSALREAFGRQQGKLQELENSKSRIAKELEEIRRKKKELRRLTGFISKLEEVRRLFDKSGLQKELRTRSSPVIETHMKGFFREFNFDYSDLSLDDNYEVTLYGQGGESTTEMISGGEKIAAALAMRLGIARTLAGGSADSMLLDEPTIYLDSQRRQDLIAVLKRLTMMPQLIVVTHDTAMEEAADRITLIKKERGVSYAEEG